MDIHRNVGNGVLITIDLTFSEAEKRIRKEYINKMGIMESSTKSELIDAWGDRAYNVELKKYKALREIVKNLNDYNTADDRAK